MIGPKCKICRRAGTKLFLKSDKCFSAKCPMIRKPYVPGKKGKRRTAALSEYGRELREKQKLKSCYNLRERQFRNYIGKVMASRGKVENIDNLLMAMLENRLDNVVFRLGFASSRIKAKQLVSHGHIMVNDKGVDISSYAVKKGDKVRIKAASLKKPIFKDLPTIIKKHKTPSWLELDADKMEGKVIGQSSLEEAAPPVEILSIFEFYSR